MCACNDGAVHLRKDSMQHRSTFDCILPLKYAGVLPHKTYWLIHLIVVTAGVMALHAEALQLT